MIDKPGGVGLTVEELEDFARKLWGRLGGYPEADMVNVIIRECHRARHSERELLALVGDRVQDSDLAVEAERRERDRCAAAVRRIGRRDNTYGNSRLTRLLDKIVREILDPAPSGDDCPAAAP